MLNDENVFDDFVKEVNTMHMLDHPNLIRLYGIVISSPMKMVWQIRHQILIAFFVFLTMYVGRIVVVSSTFKSNVQIRTSVPIFPITLWAWIGNVETHHTYNIYNILLKSPWYKLGAWLANFSDTFPPDSPTKNTSFTRISLS